MSHPYGIDKFVQHSMGSQTRPKGADEAIHWSKESANHVLVSMRIDLLQCLEDLQLSLAHQNSN
jgi:hypothetical protein